MLSFMTHGPLLIFAAAVLWGLDGVLRRALYDLPPATIVFYEHLIGLLIISPFLLLAWRKERPSRREWGVLALIALLSGVLGTLFFTSALLATAFIPFSVVFLLQKLQPVFAASAAAALLKERLGVRYVSLAAAALLAGYFVTFPDGVVRMSEGGGHALAALLALAAALCWGASTALSRYALLARGQTLVTGLRFLLTVPIALVFVFALGAGPSLLSVTPSHLLMLSAIALSTGMLALWIYYRGLRTTPASVSTIVELAFPVTAIALDYFLYGTVLAWTQYAAALALLGAMYLVARTPGRGRVQANAGEYSARTSRERVQ